MRRILLGVFTWLVGPNPGVLQMIQRAPLGNDLGREKMQFNLESAVQKYSEQFAGVEVTQSFFPFAQSF